MTNARELSKRLADLLRKEHGAMADFLLALADFDEQRHCGQLGYSGLFPFLNRELGLSKAASYFRKTAADLLRRFPEVVEPLRDGRLCLTAVVELAKVITPENRAEVLPRFFHCSKREAKEVSAALAPREMPPRREVITAVAPRAASATARQEQLVASSCAPTREVVRPGEPSSPEGPTLASAPSAASPARRDEIEPLTADLRRLHVTVSRRFLAKLDAARDALSHSNPGATTEEILEAGLDLLLDRAAKRKGIVEKPRKEPPPSSPASRHIPAHVKRAVWKRDGGRCQWRMEDGSICGSTFQVELDHVHPWALGGPSTIENTRLACRGHNQLAARRAFGDAWMDRYARQGRAKEPAEGAPPP
jgi:hypothetical protein